VVESVKVLEFARSNRERYLLEFKEFLSIPTISTLSEHKPDMQRAAEWLAKQLKGLGMKDVEIMPTDGHPVVYGEWLGASGKPVVLVYGHYDVQPVDPLNDWKSPPFTPTVRGDNIYARGAHDNKGQLHAVLKALEAWQKTATFPVNVKVLFEGEEEIGSKHLESFIKKNKEKLKCDFVLNVDSSILRPDVPSLVYGLRGMSYFEIWVQGAKNDLHSGLYGGTIDNPAQVLCQLIAGMHDNDGRVTLPGFYDRVRVLSDEERQDLARLPLSDEDWLRITGAPGLHGERGYTLVERIGARPTLEVNGILAGFTGEGTKTVLPAKAMAKISMRLVPYQDPTAVEGQLKDYLRQHAPPTVTWEVKMLVTASPALVDRNTPAMRAATEALEATFGVKPVFQLQGGSVPVVSMMKDVLGVDTVLMGFGLPDDNVHGPNEKQYLPNYYRGIESYIRFFDSMEEGVCESHHKQLRLPRSISSGGSTIGQCSSLPV
jgi:acetylornithine deacetylase/succinyl-diaminopimelate desuccinylase-like protein